MEDYDYGGNDDDDYYDEYVDDGQPDVYLFNPDASVRQTMSDCILPSLTYAAHNIISFIVINAAFHGSIQLVRRLSPAQRYVDMLSCCFGLLLMCRVIDTGYFHFAQLSATLFLLLAISLRFECLQSPFYLTFYGIGNLLLSELFEQSKETWNHIRGMQMVLLMKAISLHFDATENRAIRERLTPLAYYGYILCPTNCIIGPWCPYVDYVNLVRCPGGNGDGGPFRNRRSVLVYLYRVIANALMAVTFMLLSNCFTGFLLPAQNGWIWLTVYGKAWSFRTSHYFVSFLSQCAMVTAGFDKPYDRYRTLANPLCKVTNPRTIEFPRSMVQIVTAWNTPMHLWLKRYVFRLVKPYGTFLAIFVTYSVSSLLHGLHYRLWLILLSIGAWTFVEYGVRRKVAAIFSACVLVNRCPDGCKQHELRSSSAFCRIVNLAFGLTNVFNLMYLGFVLDDATDGRGVPLDEQRALGELLNKWAELHFASHWLLLATYLFHLFI